ncbi:MAG: PD-(D/E)XK nuclease family protein [Rikenellaceae bacterium]
MRSFLSEVADDLYAKYGDGVGAVKMLFPSRRARLFFSDALATIAQKPIWEPEWVEIDRLMSRVAGIEIGERVRLIAELYSIYVEFHPGESFDRFYFWGEILLGDFDMVDKYMIDADMLFRNVADIKELDADLSYLTESQIRIVTFWSSLGDDTDLSKHKRRFLEVWRSLRPIYHKFRQRLRTLGIAYAGMVHRVAAERLQSGDYSFAADDHYVVAGFNALSGCEKVLFEALRSSSTTHFYWDWDNYYTQNSEQEAGLFIKDNIARFAPSAQISHDNFERHKDIEVVATSSTALECKYVADILESIVAQGGVIDKRTAIVLTDESLLLPLLYALPQWVGRVNVTMGYPLRQSLAYSFVERLLQLQHHARGGAGEVTFYHTDVMGILTHPYLCELFDERFVADVVRRVRDERMIRLPQSVVCVDDFTALIFGRCEGWQSLSRYITAVVERVVEVLLERVEASDDRAQRIEFLSFLGDQVTALHNSVEQCGVESLEVATYVSLLRRHLQPLRIPFEGEPLEGLQIMGILETRNLDFENVIILSMNDDNFPGNRLTQPSYIPYNLRAAYELPTPEHHDGVYAYYFYRLVQRASRLWMLYCSCADEQSTGEQSRYITQLDFESPFTLHRTDVGVDVNLFDNEPIVVAKEGAVAEKLRRYVVEGEQRSFDGESSWGLKKLSPTALCQYVACPMRFYFSAVAGIRTRDEELVEQVDAPMFGTILHDAMQYLYEPLIGVVNMGDALSLIKPQQIDRAVLRAINVNYFRREGEGDDLRSDQLSGDLMLVREVVSSYISKGILRYDCANPSFEVMGAEMAVEHFVELASGDKIRLWGKSDRVDRLSDGVLRVVDYKTGQPHLEFKGVEALFEGADRSSQANILQTMLYSYMLAESRAHCELVLPTLYYVRKMNTEEYSPLLVDVSQKPATAVDSLNFDQYYREFLPLIGEKLEELFDFTHPFTQCDDSDKTCEFCDYRTLCRR